MCSDPRKFGDVVTACRSCNECLNARKNTWVARAMAETSTSKSALIFTLTYADDTHERRKSARFFRYNDVRNFLASLRSALRYAGKSDKVRFMVVGEQGSKKGRVHWHGILWSDEDLTALGSFRFKGKIAPVEYRKRLDWSMWPHGFVQLDVANQQSIAYCLKYILKDQFSYDKGRGKLRDNVSERYASSRFRMSKRPAIGTVAFDEFWASHARKGTLPLTLSMPVDGYSGYWFFTEKFRLRAMRHVVDIVRSERDAGRVPVALYGFLSRLSDKDKELYYETIKTEAEWRQEFEQSIAEAKARAAVAAREGTLRNIRPCYRLVPCQRCVNSLSRKELRSVERIASKAVKAEGPRALRRLRETPSRYCQRREDLPANSKGLFDG